MTITTSTNRVVQYGNGATTVWNYSFLIPDATEVVVQITDKTTGVVTTLTALQYSISGLGNPAGGTVTYSPALTTNQSITITRILPVTQTVSLSNQGAFYPAVVEGALDYLTMVAQQVSDSIGRALQISPNGVNTIDAQNNRIINVAAPVATTDAARIADVQAAQATGNQVPTPVLGNVGQFLKATAAGAYAWVAFVSSNISDATAAGIALLTGANAAAQRTSLGLGTLATLSTVTATEVTANTLTFAKFQRTGSVGQVWVSGGAGADPSYVGSVTLLASGSVSAVATLDLTLPTGYKRFMLVLDGLVPATNNNGLAARFSFDNGSTYKSGATDYIWALNYWNTAATGGGYDHSTGSRTYINVGAFSTGLINTANQQDSYSLEIYPGTASLASTVLFRCLQTGLSNWAQSHGAGASTNAFGQATNFRLLFSAGGNISSGIYALYGVN